MRFILAEDFLRFLDYFVSLFSCAFRLFSSDMAAPAARKNHATLSVSVINNNTLWSDLNKIQSLGDTIWQMDLAGTPRSQSHTTSKEFESRTGLRKIRTGDIRGVKLRALRASTTGMETEESARYTNKQLTQFMYGLTLFVA